MSHYLYIIATVSSGGLLPPIKIGITATPSYRLSSLRTGCPNKIEFAATFQVRERSAARDLERSLHEHWDKHLVRVEWFNVEPYEAVATAANIIEMAVIKSCANCDGDISLIREKLVWTGVEEARKRLAEARYVRAWESLAA